MAVRDSAFLGFYQVCYLMLCLAFTCFSVQENPHSEPLLQPLPAPSHHQ